PPPGEFGHGATGQRISVSPWLKIGGTTIDMRWDGEGYHRVATVQERWGLQLLRQVPRAHYLRLLDAGCGSGRLTAHLLRKFPEAHVLGLDVAGATLEPARRKMRRYQRHLQHVQ